METTALNPQPTTANANGVGSNGLVLPPASEIKVGDEVWIMVKGISNDREYKTSAEVVEIRHGHFATVRYKQPWGKWRRDTIVDLRRAKKINRRQTRRQNVEASQPQPAIHNNQKTEAHN